MTENDLLLKIEGLEKIIQEKNADASRYQDKLKQTKQIGRASCRERV